MGLDTVELVRDVEDTFGIEIPDEVAGGIVTVGELYRYVKTSGGSVRRSQPFQQPTAVGCLSRTIFCKLRNRLLDLIPADRRQIRPNQSLNSLIPLWQRREVWRALQDALGYRLPPLTRHPLIVAVASAAWLVGVGMVLMYVTPWAGFGVAIMLALLLAVADACSYVESSAALAIYFPPEMRTVGQLTERVLVSNYDRISQEYRVADSRVHDEIWDMIRHLIVRNLGVDGSSITKETRFVDDLGCG